MEKQNDWLAGNTPTIDGIRRQLIDYHMKGSYGGEIELLQIERLLRGATLQIVQLQKEVNTLTKENKIMEGMLKPTVQEEVSKSPEEKRGPKVETRNV